VHLAIGPSPGFAGLRALTRVRGWMGVVAALALSALLSGCGSVTGTIGPISGGSDVRQASLAQGGRRSVCVASVLGPYFSVVSLGLTALTTEQTDVPVDSWQTDDHVRRRVHELISTSYDVRHIETAAKPFYALEQTGALFRNLASERADLVRKIVYGERCDYILVVLRGQSSYGSSGQTLRGVGIVRSGDGIVIDDTYLYALASVVFYENHSFKVLAERKLPAEKSGLFTSIGGPHRKVNASSWPVPANTADSPQMKTAVLSLLDAALAEVVPEVVNVKQ
jgi:uncharacterized protein YceK